MRKVYDITEKLSFDEKPVMVIRGEEFEINDDAPTMLIVLEKSEKMTNRELLEVGELLFGKEQFEKLKNLKRLNIDGLFTAITEAMTLASGEADEEGESQNTTMTSQETGTL